MFRLLAEVNFYIQHILQLNHLMAMQCSREYIDGRKKNRPQRALYKRGDKGRKLSLTVGREQTLRYRHGKTAGQTAGQEVDSKPQVE